MKGHDIDRLGSASALVVRSGSAIIRRIRIHQVLNINRTMRLGSRQIRTIRPGHKRIRVIRPGDRIIRRIGPGLSIPRIIKIIRRIRIRRIFRIIRPGLGRIRRINSITISRPGLRSILRIRPGLGVISGANYLSCSIVRSILITLIDLVGPRIELGRACNDNNYNN